MHLPGSLNINLPMKDWRYLSNAVEWRLKHLQDIAQDPDKTQYFPDISEEIDALEAIQPLIKKELKPFGEFPTSPF